MNMKYNKLYNKNQGKMIKMTESETQMMISRHEKNNSKRKRGQ